jgi:hypothetical protein
MRRSGLPDQTLEALGVREHLAPLLGQGRQCCGAFVLPGHTDSEDLLGFLPSRPPTKRRQAQGDARRIRRLAYPVTLAHPEQRFDRIGTDRYAPLSESSGRGDPQLMRQRGAKLLADGGGGHGVNARFALRDGGRPQTSVFEKVLAGQ